MVLCSLVVTVLLLKPGEAQLFEGESSRDCLAVRRDVGGCVIGCSKFLLCKTGIVCEGLTEVVGKSPSSRHPRFAINGRSSQE